MRKIVAIPVICLFAASAVAPASGAQSTRKVTTEYTMANGMVAFNSASAHWTIGTAYHAFRPRAGERFVTFSISDDSGFPARGQIHIDADADGNLDRVEDFCGETRKPIKVGTAKEIELGVIFGTCPDNSPAIVTQGTVTATFSK
ncbi:MAG: hypothetical protein KY391_05585 [Actinobacteria bacterium]|nr:hypothetical protein [Actinomycetota bacterium]